MPAYEDTNLQLFFKIAYKPRAALKFRALLVVPVNIPGAKILAKSAEFYYVIDIAVLPGPLCSRLKKNYCSF